MFKVVRVASVLLFGGRECVLFQPNLTNELCVYGLVGCIFVLVILSARAVFKITFILPIVVVTIVSALFVSSLYLE